MTREDQRKVASRIAVAAGAGVVLISAVLIVGQLIVMSRAPQEAARLEELEERLKTDAEAAPELEAERERQTQRSVAREARNLRLGYVLLAAAVAFLLSFPGSAWERSPRRSASLPRRAAPERTQSVRRELPKRAREPGMGLEEDLSYVDTVIARQGRGREAAIPALQALQAHYRYLPEAALRRLCERTEITPSQIAGVASFYAQFRRTPMGEHRVRVCHGTACHVAGVGHIMDELRRRLGIPQGDDTDPERRFTLDPVACLGCCSLAPVLMIDDDVAARLTPTSVWEVLAEVPLADSAHGSDGAGLGRTR